MHAKNTAPGETKGNTSSSPRLPQIFILNWHLTGYFPCNGCIWPLENSSSKESVEPRDDTCWFQWHFSQDGRRRFTKYKYTSLFHVRSIKKKSDVAARPTPWADEFRKHLETSPQSSLAPAFSGVRCKRSALYNISLSHLSSFFGIKIANHSSELPIR